MSFRKSKVFVICFTLALLGALFFTSYPRHRNIYAHATPQLATHLAHLPYYSLKDGWQSELTLNNAGHQPLTASVTLFSLSGESLTLPDILIAQTSTARLQLGEAVASQHTNKFNEGSIEVRFGSNDPIALAPQLTVANPKQRISFDLEPPMGFKSSKLDGLWWSAGEKTQGQVMLCNTTAQNLETSLEIEWKKSVVPGPSITLLAHQTVVLDVEKLLKDSKLDAKGIESGGLSITHNGEPGALIAFGMIEDKENDFASSLNFVDAKAQPTATLDGTGLLLGRQPTSASPSNKNFFVPKLTLKNTTVIAQTAKVIVNYERDGNWRNDTIATITLAPREVQMVNLGRFVSNLSNVSIGKAAIKISYGGEPGAVIGILSSVNQNGGAVDVPLVSRKANSGEGGNHPFRIDDGFRSVAYLTNITDKPTKVLVGLFHGSGMYTPELIPVAPGATVTIDLLQLRESQVKDVQGRFLPTNLKEGQFFWTPHGAGALIGRILMTDETSGAVSNFSCPNCCQLEPYLLTANPDPVTGYAGNVQQMTVYEYETYCGQYTMGPYDVTSSVSYSSTNTSVMTVNSTGAVTCQSVGTATVSMSLIYYHSDFISAEDCGLFEATLTGTCPGAVKPTIDSLQATMPTTKNPVTNQVPTGSAVSVTNTDTSFATDTSSDLIAIFLSTTVQMTVTATGVNPAASASQLLWKIDRDSTDTVDTGRPTLDTTSGATVKVTPTKAGNFRLICYFDSNGNNQYESGEEIKTVRFAVVRATLTTDINSTNIVSGGFSLTGAPDGHGGYGISPDSNTFMMLIFCRVLLEGGGANRTIGISQMMLGDVANLTADSAKVNYGATGTETETPNQQLPMIDCTSNPSGGDTAFRTIRHADLSAGPGGNGKYVDVDSSDNPGFGPFDIVHPNTHVTWTSTQGGYDFREYIAGYSTSFPRYYVVFAKADWTVRFNGNNSGGNWVNNGSTISLSTTTPQSLTNLITGNAPQSGDAAGIQVLGKTFADILNRPFVPNP